MPTKSAYPKRIAQGYDPKRLEILVAILSKKCGVALYDSDVFLNVPGGFSIREPGADFAACMSMVSSYFDKSLPKGLVAIGEVGLTGEIRDVVGQDRRIKDARRLGFKHTISSRDFTNLNKAIKVLLK
jgi:DNA repair protein RadA/Sms